jgi:hypothetical protein
MLRRFRLRSRKLTEVSVLGRFGESAKVYARHGASLAMKEVWFSTSADQRQKSEGFERGHAGQREIRIGALYASSVETARGEAKACGPG